ncbi:MAG: GNAT family N-acetyltransferase, partial [Coprobacillus sp.]
HRGSTGEIVELIVLPEYRGLKVGHRLIEHVENVAKQLGLIEIDLSTSTYRKKAHRFYEAHGFVKDHYNYTKDI